MEYLIVTGRKQLKMLEGMIGTWFYYIYIYNLWLLQFSYKDDFGDVMELALF